jgi:O-antigen/teichoic acid export membrane protein
LGLQDAIPRFVPIYRENREYGKMFGTILLAAGAVLATGIFIVGVIWQAPLLHHYDAYRFAFPSRRNELIESAAEHSLPILARAL